MRFVGIDPSTKTGFVALDQFGNVIKAKELTGINRPDPIRMITLVDEIMDHIQPGDQVFIEGFAHAAKGIMSAKCLESDGESEWHLPGGKSNTPK
ncbi:hypothetical protein P7H17_05960 [Paenibacillus larvae]|nr:hypothetical protein [Paenibacillus larvae]MDT2285730.1 hypothetical protein [Paenibacillus larvae]